MDRTSLLLLTSVFFTLPALAASADRTFAVAEGEMVHCQVMEHDSTGGLIAIPGTATSCAVRLIHACNGVVTPAGCKQQYYLLTGCKLKPHNETPGYDFLIQQSPTFAPDLQKATHATADLTVIDSAFNRTRTTWNGGNARTISAPLSDTSAGEVVCKID